METPVSGWTYFSTCMAKVTKLSKSKRDGLADLHINGPLVDSDDLPVLGDSLGALGHGMLGQPTGQQRQMAVSSSGVGTACTMYFISSLSSFLRPAWRGTVTRGGARAQLTNSPAV